MLTVKEYKEKNGFFSNENLKKYLCNISNFGGTNNDKLSDLFSKYLDDDRDILVDTKRNIIYFSTCPTKKDACYLRINENHLKIYEIVYNRIGNGKNQSGTLICRDFLGKSKSYAIKISHICKHPRLTFFPDIERIPELFVAMDIDPITLNGSWSEENRFNADGALALFRKSILKGKNIINGKIVESEVEDNNIFETQHLVR